MNDSTPLANDKIVALARKFWEEEGQPEGKAEEHWQRAEAQLRRELMETLAANSAPPIAPIVAGIS